MARSVLRAAPSRHAPRFVAGRPLPPPSPADDYAPEGRDLSAAHDLSTALEGPRVFPEPARIRESAASVPPPGESDSRTASGVEADPEPPPDGAIDPAAADLAAEAESQPHPPGDAPEAPPETKRRGRFGETNAAFSVPAERPLKASPPAEEVSADAHDVHSQTRRVAEKQRPHAEAARPAPERQASEDHAARTRRSEAGETLAEQGASAPASRPSGREDHTNPPKSSSEREQERLPAAPPPDLVAQRSEAEQSSETKKAMQAASRALDTDEAAPAGKEESVMRAAPHVENRSPQAWAARLQRALEDQAKDDADEPAERAQQREPQEPPPPLSLSTRRFLRPLVGLDPADVRVRWDAPAREEVEVQHAEGLAVGDEVLLAAAPSVDDPKALGVLAHELTHVARRRVRRFVPPAAQAPHAAFEGPRRSLPDDEEAVASAVEGAAVQAARDRRDAMSPRRADDVSPAAVQETGDAEGQTTSARSEPTRSWGGLPAPWEPFPEGQAAGAAPGAPTPDRSEGGRSHVDGRETTESAPGPPGESPSAGRAPRGRPTAGAAAPVQRAARGRRQASEGEEARAGATGSAQAAATALPPDLDDLARQVHDVLKRRIAAERRRAGGFLHGA